MLKFGLAVVASFCVAGCLSPQRAMGGGGNGGSSSGGGASAQTFVYAQGATQRGPLDLELDFYPGGKSCVAPRPVMVFVHGGGFKGGDRSRGKKTSEAFAAEGFNAFSIDYRLLSDRPQPSGPYRSVASMIAQSGEDQGMSNAVAAAFEDTVSALRFVRSNASNLCSDPNKVVLYGRSAGAITVLNVAYALDDLGIKRPKIRGVLSNAGGSLMDGTVEQGDVPVMLMHGQKDDVVPYADAEAVWAQTQATGTAAHFHSFANRDHGINAFSLRVGGKPLIDVAIDFAKDAVNGQVFGSIRTTN